MLNRRVLKFFFRRYSTSLPIPKNEFIERRSRLLDSLAERCSSGDSSQNNEKNSILALIVTRPHTFSAPDVPHVYRQCSNFRYFSGLDGPRMRILIGAKESVIFAEPQTAHQVLWEGATQSPSEICEISGIDQVLPTTEFHKFLASSLQAGQAFAVDIDSLLDATVQEPDLRGIQQMLSSGALRHIPLNDKIDRLRWRKSEQEQELMRKACRIGSEAINAIFRECRDVADESHLVGFLEHQCRVRGAKHLAYPPVVAAGTNANTIHYIASNKSIHRNDCVLVDAGCDFHGYVSDITRCFPSSGKFSTAQKTLYDVLNHIQAKLLYYVQNTRPLRLNELYRHMLENMADALSSIVFFRKDLSRDELLKECDALCPHHVAHYLGMDVHDTPSVPRNIECLPGVVITVEPGIYIRPENESVRDEFKGIGFRIEDDVLLTENGAEILTSNCVRDSGEIELLMRS